MKKLILFGYFLFTSIGFSQITVFEDSFDTYNDFVISGFGNWGTIDLDMLNTYTGGTSGNATWPNAGAPQAFQIFNPTTALVTNTSDGCSSTTENANFTPHMGAKYAACWAGVPAGGVNANNDWLVSPPINLSGYSGCSLNVWLKALSDCYGAERYRIGVYTGTGTPTQSSDFVILTGITSLTVTSWQTWQLKTQSLAAYDGQTIRIGIQCVSSDAYMFMVDDFKVTANSMATSDFVSSKMSIYPNPADNVISIQNTGKMLLNKVTITDINGRTVKSNMYNDAIDAQINISDLNSGVYFVNIDTTEGSAIKKFVKK